ncbi:unnamed protein product, partial [Pocillopora meandrina]
FFAGVGVERNDFSDPQGGKGICDRQAVTIKGDIGRYVNEGNDVTTAIQLKTAIESGPGSCAKASYVTFNPKTLMFYVQTLAEELIYSIVHCYEESMYSIILKKDSQLCKRLCSEKLKSVKFRVSAR